jgi:hypothetical protein
MKMPRSDPFISKELHYYFLSFKSPPLLHDSSSLHSLLVHMWCNFTTICIVFSCLSHVRYFELMVVVKRRMEGGEKIMYHYKEHWNVHQVHGRLTLDFDTRCKWLWHLTIMGYKDFMSYSSTLITPSWLI